VVCEGDDDLVARVPLSLHGLKKVNAGANRVMTAAGRGEM
jgi:hypothetical protein